MPRSSSTEPTNGAPPPTRARDALLALVAFAALAVALFSPNLPYLTTHAIGSTGTDGLKHVWGQWWVWDQLRSTGTLPLATDLIYFPEGGDFFCLDTGNALLTAPLRLFAAPLVVYNLLYILHTTLNGWAAWWLARDLTADSRASLVAGALFAIGAPALAFPVNSGVSEAAFAFPLPLIWWAGIRLLRDRRWRDAALTAGLLLLQAACSWTLAVIGALGLFLLGVGWLAHRPWTRPAGAPWTLDRTAALRVALSVAILAIAVMPLYLAISGTVGGEDAVYERQSGLFPGPSSPDPRTLPETNSTPLVDLFSSGDAGLRVNQQGVERLMFAANPGWVAWALALVVVIRGRRWQRWALALGAAFALFSMGPLIHVDHARTWPGLTNPVFLAFHYVFPLFNAMVHDAERHLSGMTLALAVAGAGALADLTRRLSNRATWGLTIGAVGLVLAEAITVSPAPWPIHHTPAQLHPSTLALAADAAPGALIELPYADPTTGRFFGDIFFQQTGHGRPVPFRLEGMGPQVVSARVQQNRFFAHAAAAAMGTTDPGGAGCDQARALAEMGFGWLRLRPDAAVDADETRRRLERCLGQPQQYGDMLLYRFPTAS